MEASNSFDENFQKNFLTGGEFYFLENFQKNFFITRKDPGGFEGGKKLFSKE